MLDQVKKVWDLLSPQERRRFLLLVPMVLGGAILDSLGVASIMPFIAVLANPGVVQSNTYLKYVYDSLGFVSENEFMRFLAAIFFVILVFSIAYKALSSYVMTRYALMREYSIGHELVRRYFGQSYEWFLSRHSADIGKTILTEVARVVGSVIIPLVQISVQIAIVLSLLTLLIMVQPQVALTIGATLVIAYGAIYLLQRSYLRKVGANIEHANRMRFRVVNEAFSGIKSVKIAGLESHYLMQFARPAFEFARNISASNIATQVPRYALEILAFGGMIGAVFFLMKNYSSFQSMLPVLAVYAFASYRLMPAIQQIYISLSTLRVGGPTLERLHAEFMSIKDTAYISTSNSVSFEREIRLEGISYIYPGSSTMSLISLDMTIPAHASVGIVGATGSGKTTTIDIILGLLCPEEGRLVVDGREINESNRANWQKLIGYVPQQIFLTDDTVIANIAYGVDPELVDLQSVIEAAKSANLHDFVTCELPKAYATLVGERGVRLSGGQLQRIGIARALYRKPRVLILDEATSALDNLTEANVIEAINRLGQRVTTVTIAHRISTVRDCDRIFVMAQGRIVDSGTYDELAGRSGRFRDMLGAAVSRSNNPNIA